MYIEKIKEILLAHHEPTKKNSSFLYNLFKKTTNQEKMNEFIEEFFRFDRDDELKKEQINEIVNKIKDFRKDSSTSEQLKQALKEAYYLLIELRSGSTYIYGQDELTNNEYLSDITTSTSNNEDVHANFIADLSRGLIVLKDSDGHVIEINKKELMSEVPKVEKNETVKRLLKIITGDDLDIDSKFKNKNPANVIYYYIDQGLSAELFKEAGDLVKFSDSKKNHKENTWQGTFTYNNKINVSYDKENKVIDAKLVTNMTALSLDDGKEKSLYFLSKTHDDALKKINESNEDEYLKIAKESSDKNIVPIIRIEANVTFQKPEGEKEYIGKFNEFRVTINTPELTSHKGQRFLNSEMYKHFPIQSSASTQHQLKA